MIITCCDIFKPELIMAILTFLALCVNIYLIVDERRPHLQFSIVKVQQAFYLKIKNVGSRNARNVKLEVKGEPIENSISDKIKESFSFLASHPFYIEAGAEKYFCIAPDKLDLSKLSECSKWLNCATEQKIAEWVDKYHNKDITISASYNCFYSTKEQFSISGFISLSAYRFKPYQEQLIETIKQLNNKWND